MNLQGQLMTEVKPNPGLFKRNAPIAGEAEEDAPKRDFGSRDPMLAGSVDRVALERAVASLPPGYRMVFVLHDVEGFEHNEIATMLECSTGNSKSQLHKARLKLRELLRLQAQLPQSAPFREVSA